MANRNTSDARPIPNESYDQIYLAAIELESALFNLRSSLEKLLLLDSAVDLDFKGKHKDSHTGPGGSVS
jgi:hypothetical protein